MNTVYKIIEDCEVKKVGERQYEFTASAETMDRDGEVIQAAGWDLKNFKKNPVIMYAHDYRSLPVGKATRVWIDRKNKTLKNTIEFPPEGTYEFADTVERLVDTGYLKTESVGFIPKEWEEGDGEKEARRTFTKQELLEISIVPVPSNPDALRNAVSDGVITTKEFEAITKPKEMEIIYSDNGISDERTNIITPPLTKPEEPEEFIRIPVRDCTVTATIDISKKEGISALYCGKEKQVRTYLFRKDKGWTMAKAKAWVKEHEGKSAHDISQEEIIDEIDYLSSLIEEHGMNDDLGEAALEFSRKVICQLRDKISEDNAKVIVAIGAGALGYGVPIEHWSKDRNGELIRGLDLRVPGSDIPVKIEEIDIQFEILEAVKRIAKKQEV